MTQTRLRALAATGALILAACGGAEAASDNSVSVEVAPTTTAPIAAPETSSTTSTAVATAVDVDVPDGLTLVSGDELASALSGNTIIGNWVGEDYRQFYDPNGETIYLADGAANGSLGEWRVNVTTGQYESLWPPLPSWDAYEVFRDGDAWFWTGQGVELSPFTIVEGDQLAGDS